MGLAVANMFVGGFLAPGFTKSTSQWPALPWVVAIVSTTVMIGVVATRAVETARASEKLEAGETKGMKLANPLAEDDDGDDDDDDKSEQDDADLE